jgi:hypothetical protein
MSKLYSVEFRVDGTVVVSLPEDATSAAAGTAARDAISDWLWAELTESGNIGVEEIAIECINPVDIEDTEELAAVA